MLIRSTPAGREAWNRHIFEGVKRDRQLLRALPAAELVELNALLRKVMLAPEG